MEEETVLESSEPVGNNLAVYEKLVNDLNILRTAGLFIAGKDNIIGALDEASEETAKYFRGRITQMGDEITALDHKIETDYKPTISLQGSEIVSLSEKIGNQIAVLRAISKHSLVNRSNPTNFEGFYQMVEDIYRSASNDSNSIAQSNAISNMGMRGFLECVEEMVNCGLLCYVSDENGFQSIGVPLLLSLENSIRYLFNREYFEVVNDLNNSFSRIGEELRRQIRLGDRYQLEAGKLREEVDELRGYKEKSEDVNSKLDTARGELEASERKRTELERENEKLRYRLGELDRSNEEGLEDEDLEHVEDRGPEAFGNEELYLFEAVGVYLQNSTNRRPDKDQILRICLKKRYNLSPSDEKYDETYKRLGSLLDELIETEELFMHYTNKRIAFRVPRDFSW